MKKTITFTIYDHLHGEQDVVRMSIRSFSRFKALVKFVLSNPSNPSCLINATPLIDKKNYQCIKFLLH